MKLVDPLNQNHRGIIRFAIVEHNAHFFDEVVNIENHVPIGKKPELSMRGLQLTLLRGRRTQYP